MDEDLTPNHKGRKRERKEAGGKEKGGRRRKKGK